MRILSALLKCQTCLFAYAFDQYSVNVSLTKYMKDIVTSKRKTPEAEISTILANYTFKGGIPKKLEDP